MRARRRTAWILTALLGLATAGLAAQAPAAGLADGAVAWRFSLGHNGWTVPAAWVPLRLELGQALTDGNLEIERANRDGQQKSVETYTLPHAGAYEFPVFVDERAARLTLRLRSGPTLLDETVLNPSARVFPGHIVLTVGLPAALQQVLGRLLEPGEPVLVAAGSLAGLPARALDWDAVSLAVLPDPGPALSPAQEAALGRWLAGGGRLVLLGVRPGTDSLAARLAGRAGLGCLVALPPGSPAPAEALDPAWWQARIALPAYDADDRLSAGRVFGRADERPAGIAVQERGAAAPIGAVALWCLFLVLACLLFRRRWLVMGLAAAAVAVAVLAAGGADRFGWWDRGVAWQGRSLVLPAGAGSLEQAVWWSDRNSVLAGLDKQLSPWAAGMWAREGAASDSGLMDPGDGPDSRWDHATDLPVLALRSAGPRLLSLAGELGTTDRTPALARLRAGAEGIRWQVPSGTGWTAAEGPPLALAADAPWLVRCASLRPGLYWEAGTGGGPACGRDGHGDGPGIWIQPLAAPEAGLAATEVAR